MDIVTSRCRAFKCCGAISRAMPRPSAAGPAGYRNAIWLHRSRLGTIDQALLAALQVKHAHCAMHCWHAALLVIDEVHVSDAYMTRLTE